MSKVSPEPRPNPTSFGAPRKIGLITKGLEAFVGREISMTPVAMDAGDIANRILSAIDYLLRHGPVLNDGQTCGINMEERFRIAFDSVDMGRALPVMRFVLERNGEHLPSRNQTTGKQEKAGGL